MLREAGFGQDGRSRRPGGPRPLAGQRQRRRPVKSGTLEKIGSARMIEQAWGAFYASRYRDAESLFRQLLDGSGAGPIDAVCGLSAISRALGRPAEAEPLIGHALHAVQSVGRGSYGDAI